MTFPAPKELKLEVLTSLTVTTDGKGRLGFAIDNVEADITELGLSAGAPLLRAGLDAVWVLLLTQLPAEMW